MDGRRNCQTAASRTMCFGSPRLTMNSKWDECKRVQAVERGSIQFIYVPAARDAAGQVTSLLKGRLWQAARWSDRFRDRSAASAERIQTRFEKERPRSSLSNG